MDLSTVDYLKPGLAPGCRDTTATTLPSFSFFFFLAAKNLKRPTSEQCNKNPLPALSRHLNHTRVRVGASGMKPAANIGRSPRDDRHEVCLFAEHGPYVARSACAGPAVAIKPRIQHGCMYFCERLPAGYSTCPDVVISHLGRAHRRGIFPVPLRRAAHAVEAPYIRCCHPSPCPRPCGPWRPNRALVNGTRADDAARAVREVDARGVSPSQLVFPLGSSWGTPDLRSLLAACLLG